MSYRLGIEPTTTLQHLHRAPGPSTSIGGDILHNNIVIGDGYTSKWQMDETQGYTLQELHRNFILSDHDLHAEERRQQHLSIYHDGIYVTLLSTAK